MPSRSSACETGFFFLSIASVIVEGDEFVLVQSIGFHVPGPMHQHFTKSLSEYGAQRSVSIERDMDRSYPGGVVLRRDSVRMTRHNSFVGPLYQLLEPRNREEKPIADREVTNSTRTEYIPLLAGVNIPLNDSQNPDDMDPEEAEERMRQLNQLIGRLQDTTSLLRDQLKSMRRAIKKEPEGVSRLTSAPPALKPYLPVLFKYQLLLALGVQILANSILTAYDLNWKGNRAADITTKVFLLILQVFNSAHIVIATVSLSKKLRYGGVGSLLAQTYLSTVLVFAGLYLTIYRFDPNSWEFSPNDELNRDNAFVQFVRTLYLSVSSATLCGAANIQPKAWYVTLIVCFQSLINFVYFASILAQTIGNFNTYTVSIQHHRDSVAGAEALQSTQVYEPQTSKNYGTNSE